MLGPPYELFGTWWLMMDVDVDVFDFCLGKL